MGTATVTTVTVPDAHVGQVVTVKGEFYRVAEVNLAHPHRPVLVPVFDPPTPTAAELSASDNDDPGVRSFRSAAHRCPALVVACGHPSHRFE